MPSTRLNHYAVGGKHPAGFRGDLQPVLGGVTTCDVVIGSAVQFGTYL